LKINANGKPSGKLGYYSGRGSLAGWLRAVVAQLAIDAHRKISRLVQIEEDREFENLAHEADGREIGKFHQTEENPEKSLIEKRGAAETETALKKAIAELAAEDKLLIKLYYFDGLNLKQAGEILGFHEATASRRVVKIQLNLRKRVEQILQTERGWKPDEIKQVLGNAASILQTDIEQIISDN
jgi:RNA polymerase sigma-70 factor (ECF subfamily)